MLQESFDLTSLNSQAQRKNTLNDIKLVKPAHPTKERVQLTRAG